MRHGAVSERDSPPISVKTQRGFDLSTLLAAPYLIAVLIEPTEFDERCEGEHQSRFDALGDTGTAIPTHGVAAQHEIRSPNDA